MNNNVEIIISDKWKNELLLAYSKNSINYNPIIDIFTPSVDLKLKENKEFILNKKFYKNYLITSSKPLKNVENGINKKSITIVKQKDGKIIRRYWVKKINNKEIVVKEHTEARWYKKIFDLKSKEIKDAKNIRKTGVKTPELVARLRIKDKGIIISAYEKTDFVPIIKIYNKSLNKEKKELIKKIRNIGLKLIKANALPSIFRSNEILVSKTNSIEFMLTDTAIGFYPISRNKLFLFEELKINNYRIKELKKVKDNPKELLKFWNKLPKNIKYNVNLRLLESVLSEIKEGKKKNIEDIRKDIKYLEKELFIN